MPWNRARRQPHPQQRGSCSHHESRYSTTNRATASCIDLAIVQGNAQPRCVRSVVRTCHNEGKLFGQAKSPRLSREGLLKVAPDAKPEHEVEIHCLRQAETVGRQLHVDTEPARQTGQLTCERDAAAETRSRSDSIPGRVTQDAGKSAKIPYRSPGGQDRDCQPVPQLSVTG